MADEGASVIKIMSFAVLFITFVTIVFFGASFMDNMRTTTRASLPQNTTINETKTGTPAFGNTSQLNNQWVTGIARVTNATTGELYNTSQWSLSVNPNDGVGTIDVSARQSGVNGTLGNMSGNYNVTYTTLRLDSGGYLVVNNATQGAYSWSPYMTVIVLALVLVVIVGGFMALRGSLGRDSGGQY